MSFVWDYFSTVEPVGNGDKGTVIVGEEDVKTLECSLFVYTYKRKPKDASMSCLVFHLIQKHNILRQVMSEAVMNMICYTTWCQNRYPI
jgi:hypothetical protein